MSKQVALTMDLIVPDSDSDDMPTYMIYLYTPMGRFDLSFDVGDEPSIKTLSPVDFLELYVDANAFLLRDRYYQFNLNHQRRSYVKYMMARAFIREIQEQFIRQESVRMYEQITVWENQLDRDPNFTTNF